MSIYRIYYSGSYDVNAKNRNEAEDKFWELRNNHPSDMLEDIDVSEIETLETSEDLENQESNTYITDLTIGNKEEPTPF